MRHPIACFVAVCLLAGWSAARAQDSQPVDSGLEERVKVTLMTVDALVMDKQGRTVPDLKQDAFELTIGGKPHTVDTFDVSCPIGAVADPVNLDKDIKRDKKANEPAAAPPKLTPVGPGVKRKIAFVFDYYTIQIPNRKWVTDAAQAMIRLSKTEEEEIMIVALGYGVRVEQKFTSDKRKLDFAMRRMENDVTLWAMEFSIGTSGKQYFSDLTTMMDVLAGHDGAKAVVLFSELTSLGAGGQQDNWFNDVTMHAAAARTAIYPSDTRGLTMASGSRMSDALARFANQSGGRMPFFTSDLSMSYRRAQRDLSCRYTLGAYVDPDQGRDRRAVRVKLKESGHELRYPEMIKLFSDEEVKKSRARAAFVEPGPYENPLVRAYAFPIHPLSTNSWDTLVAVNFPMPVGEKGAELDIAAAIRRGNTRVDKYKNSFTIEPPGDGGKRRPVTVFGDTKLKSGQHSMTVVLSEPGGRDIVSARTDFTVPETPEGVLILRGPILARVVPGGKLIHADKKEKQEPTKLDEILGDDKSFEPLLVHQIKASDELLGYWNACVFGKSQLESDIVVHRALLDADGQVVKEIGESPLELEPAGKKLRCHDNLGSLPGGTLSPGEYTFEVTISYANSGDLLARGTAPLVVE